MMIYTIKKGHQGIDVYQMEYYLNCLKTVYPALPALVEDGNLGSMSENAIAIFQTKTGLTTDGIITSMTWDKIILKYKLYCQEHTPSQQNSIQLKPISFGDQGLAILKIQSYLNQLFLFKASVKIDGLFQVTTQNKVIEFQKQNNLLANGRIDNFTWNKIIQMIK